MEQSKLENNGTISIEIKKVMKERIYMDEDQPTDFIKTRLKDFSEP
jgi:hypothetical protein